MGRKGRRKVGEDANIGSVMLKCKKIFYNPLINSPFLYNKSEVKEGGHRNEV